MLDNLNNNVEDRIIVRGLPFAQKGVKGRPQYE